MFPVATIPLGLELVYSTKISVKQLVSISHEYHNEPRETTTMTIPEDNNILDPSFLRVSSTSFVPERDWT